MRRVLERRKSFRRALIGVLAAIAAPGASAQEGCSDPGAFCRRGLETRCLALSAGSEQARRAKCDHQLARYGECLASIAERCVPAEPPRPTPSQEPRSSQEPAPSRNPARHAAAASPSCADKNHRPGRPVTDDFTHPGFWLNGRYELRSKTWIQTFRTEMIFTVKTCDDRPQIQVEGRNRAIKSQELTLFRDPQGVWTLEIVITEAVGVTFDALFKFPSARPQARAVDHFLPSAAAANYLRRID